MLQHLKMQSSQANAYHPLIKYQSAGFDHINTSHGDSSAMESQIYPVSTGTEPFPSQHYASVIASPHPQQHLGVWNDAPMRRALSSYPNSAIYDESRSFALSESTEAMQSWGGGCHLKVAPTDVAPRTLSAPPEYFAYPSTSFDPWQVQRKPEDIIDLDNFVAGLAGHDGSQQFSTNINVNIVDLRIPVTSGNEQLPSDAPTNHVRHSSASSSSDSSNGPVGDNLAYEELSSTYNTTPDSSDFRSRDSLSLPTYSVGGSSVSPNLPFQLSPPGGVIRGRQGSHGRAASTPHASLPVSNARFTPYAVDKRQAKNWSTSSVATALVPTARQWAPLVYKHQQRFMPQPHGQWNQSPYQSPPPPPLPDHGYGYAPIRPHPDHTYTSTHVSMQPYLSAAAQPTSYDSSSSPYDHSYHPAPLMSHGIFRMLQSNAEAVHHQPYRHADLCDPPDLFASLQEAQSAPSKEDMNPSDPDLVPHEQDLRFDGDLYTPRWVRGHGNKREGWCGICKPGRWLVLKNSAFWYDKSFSHGVSAATGSQFHEPHDTRRMDGNPDVWEGLCGSCNDWIALVSSKKKGTTWFRHAYKCHTHPKVKDAPKRKRESSHTHSLQSGFSSEPQMISSSPPCSIPAQPVAPAPLDHEPHHHQQAHHDQQEDQQAMYDQQQRTQLPLHPNLPPHISPYDAYPAPQTTSSQHALPPPPPRQLPMHMHSLSSSALDHMGNVI